MSRLNRFTLATAQRPHSILNRCFWVEMQGRHWRSYGTSVTLNDDEAANEAADALQAAYFRRSLCDERAHLLTEIFQTA